ncbi:hypothetical protein ID875_21115 [Streptomyces globisporus]|uniref:Uncharacterized protein n=1 Tax=Streptomyces globisporus TaxID=1908 RepID=A0A927BNG8_STRGL|nr:hypothetical protein [Streptomyces globisporus]
MDFLEEQEEGAGRAVLLGREPGFADYGVRQVGQRGLAGLAVGFEVLDQVGDAGRREVRERGVGRLGAGRGLLVRLGGGSCAAVRSASRSASASVARSCAASNRPIQ